MSSHTTEFGGVRVVLVRAFPYKNGAMVAIVGPAGEPQLVLGHELPITVLSKKKKTEEEKEPSVTTRGKVTPMHRSFDSNKEATCRDKNPRLGNPGRNRGRKLRSRLVRARYENPPCRCHEWATWIG